MTNRIGPMTEPLGTPLMASAILGQGSIDVHLKRSLAEETFDPAYYNGGNVVSSEFI